MSECPNCGSAGRISYDDCIHLESYSYECGSRIATDNPKNAKTLAMHGWVTPIQTRQCELIRSLREELAEANRDLLEWQHEWMVAGRDAERDRIADHLELRASKLEDELAISETSTETGLERMLAVIKSLRKEAIALRNNEHRSDT